MPRTKTRCNPFQTTSSWLKLIFGVHLANFLIQRGSLQHVLLKKGIQFWIMRTNAKTTTMWYHFVDNVDIKLKTTKCGYKFVDNVDIKKIQQNVGITLRVMWV